MVETAKTAVMMAVAAAMLALAIVTAGGGGPLAPAPAAAKPVYCSKTYADHINSLSDAERMMRINHTVAVGQACGWIVYEDGSVVWRP